MYGGVARAGRAARSLVPPAPATQQHIIHKFNSTSSLYIKDTLQAPDLDEITWWCVARQVSVARRRSPLAPSISVAIARLVKQGHENPKKICIDIFDERARPLVMKKGCYPVDYQPRT